MSSRKPRFLEAPTSFTAGANSSTAKLNNRTTRLQDHNLVNTVGRIQDNLTYADNHFFVNNEEVKDINRKLEKQGLGELTIRPTAALLRNFGGLDEDVEGLNVINSPEIQHFASDKAYQRKSMWNDPGVSIPYQPTDEFFGPNGEPLLDDLAEEFEGMEHLGVVEQPRADSAGDGIKFYDTFSEAIEEYQENGLPQKSMISLQLPLQYDQRVIAAGDTPVTSMKRYPNDEGVCSLSKIDGEDYKEKAIKGKEKGYVEPVDIEELDPAVENILEDHVEALERETDEDNFWIGWDFFAIDPYQMDEFPEYIRDHLMDEDYRTEEGNYLVLGEPNASPGSGVDIVNQEYEEQDSAANLLRYGDAVSRGESFDRGLDSVGQLSGSDIYDMVKEHQV